MDDDEMGQKNSSFIIYNSSFKRCSPQNNVKTIAEREIRLGQIQIKFGNQQLAPARRHAQKNRVKLKQRVARKVHLRHQPTANICPKK